MITTAAILARGRGERMRSADDSATLTDAQRAAADKGAKVMMPFARPFLDYVISALADVGVNDVIIVVDPSQEEIRQHYGALFPPQRTTVSFATQAMPKGTADAVVAASLVIGGDRFLVLNADNYYPVFALKALANCDTAATIGFDADELVAKGNFERDRIQAFAVLESDDDGYLKSIIEKPTHSPMIDASHTRSIGMNCWTITPAIVDACKRVPLSERGEFELPQAVALALGEGTKVRVIPMKAPVFDLSRRADIASVAIALSDIIPRT